MVTRVIDGDTIAVKMGGLTDTIRYIGIDTPETGDWLAADATKFNEGLVIGKAIKLEKDVSDRDAPSGGRLLRYVHVDSVSVNAELVRAGLARATPYPPDVKYQALFKQLETEAANAARGLWAMPQIVRVFFDGLKSGEPDEYVEISNCSGKPINMTGWKIEDKGNRHSFTFPSFVLDTGRTIRVYTNESHPEFGGLSFKSPSAIWNNDGDTAVLYDNQGKAVSRRRY